MAEGTPNLPEQLHSRPGTDVAVRPSDGGGLSAEDLLIPRMKIGQKTSRDVLDYAGIYVLQSRDDMEPTLVAKPPTKLGDLGPAVRFYVHGDPRKGWSWKPAQEGGDWRSTEYPSLNLVEGQDPKNVRRTYDYLLTLPDYPALPVMFIMHGQWGGQSAKQINTNLVSARLRGLDSSTLAFKLQVFKTESPKGGQNRPFVQAVVGLDKVAAKDKASDLELVEAHRFIVGGAENVRTVEDEDTTAAATPASAPSLD